MNDMKISGNITVQSNLMVDKGDMQLKHLYLPGDFVAIVEPDLIDKSIIDRELTIRQKEEFLRYLPCSLCRELICKCK